MMSHSMDLRRRVVAYVRGGGSKAEAARRFGVHHGCVFDWITRDRLEAKKPGPRKAHKLDMEALQQAVECQPEVMGKELAVHFGVRPSTICYALKRLNISRKKNLDV